MKSELKMAADTHTGFYDGGEGGKKILKTGPRGLWMPLTLASSLESTKFYLHVTEDVEFQMARVEKGQTVAAATGATVR